MATNPLINTVNQSADRKKKEKEMYAYLDTFSYYEPEKEKEYNPSWFGYWLLFFAVVGIWSCFLYVLLEVFYVL